MRWLRCWPLRCHLLRPQHRGILQHGGSFQHRESHHCRAHGLVLDSLLSRHLTSYNSQPYSKDLSNCQHHRSMYSGKVLQVHLQRHCVGYNGRQYDRKGSGMLSMTDGRMASIPSRQSLADMTLWYSMFHQIVVLTLLSPTSPITVFRCWISEGSLKRNGTISPSV